MPVVSLFVSSTFRDFHAERDLLLGAIRAELDDRVAQFGCRVEVIDLRWGLGLDEFDEALAQERTLSVCLAEIDRSRPLFVGLLGDRYGWVPPIERVRRVAVEAGWAGGVADGWSVTALEFEHGAFRHEGEHPVFFVRDLVGLPPTGWVENDRRAVDLRERVMGDARAVVQTYRANVDGARVTDLSEFEGVVLATLGPLVEARARAMAVGEADPVSVAQRLFLEARTTVVGRADEVELLRSLIGQRRSVCLSGASGVGKSTLWRVAAELAAAPRSASLVVGVAPGTTGVADVIGRLAGQLGLEPPQLEADELLAWWRSALVGEGEVLLAIDGLDGLDADAADLRWLAGLPESVQLLVSTTDAGHSELLARQGGVVSVPIGELDGYGVMAMLAALAGELRRSLPAAVVSLLAQRSRSPLWVQLAFSDLTGLDENDFLQVNDPTDVARLLAAAAGELPDDEAGLVAALCDRVDAANPGAVEPIVTLLAHSRSGLNPLDLAELTGMDPVVIARVRRGFAGLIAPRGTGGRLGFTHGLVRQASLYRHPTDGASVHARLATHHAPTAAIDRISGDDALWHTLLAGTRVADLLDPLLRSVQPFSDEAEAAARTFTLAAQHDLASVLECVACSELTSGSLITLGWYLQEWGPTQLNTTIRSQLASTVLDIAARLAAADANNAQAQRDLSISFDNVADVAMQRGDLETADNLYRQSLDIARQLADANVDDAFSQRHLSIALNCVAGVAARRGDYESADALYRQSLDIARRLVAADTDDAQWQRSLSTSLNHVAGVALRRGDYAGAEALYRQSLDIARQVANADTNNAQLQRDLSIALTHVAGAALRRGDLDDADVAYRQSLEILGCLAAGDAHNAQAQRDLCLALNNVSEMTLRRGDLDTADVTYRQTLDIARRLAVADGSDAAAQRDLSIQLNHVAGVAALRGDLGGADVAYRESLDIRNWLVAVDTGNAQAQRDLSIQLNHVARVALKRGDLANADAAYRQSLDITRRLAAGDANDAQAQRDLLVSLDNVAVVAFQRGFLGDAVADWVQAAQLAIGFPYGHPIGAELRPYFAGRLDAVVQQLKRKDRDLAARCRAAAAQLRGTT